MLCLGVLFCFVLGALCKDVFVSLGQDCCVSEANWVLYRVGKFGRAKISSVLVLEERESISAASSVMTDMKIHPASKCGYNQLYFQLYEFSIPFFPSPLAVCVERVGPLQPAPLPQAGCQASCPAPCYSLRVCCRSALSHAAAWSHLMGSCCACGRLQGPVLAHAQCWGFLEHICKELCRCFPASALGCGCPTSRGVAGHRSPSLLLLAGGFLQGWRQRAIIGAA